MDWVINDELQLTAGDLVGWAAAAAMIIGGVAPYIPQYRHIKQTQDPEGFSLHVCLALLIANTLRILFWFGKRYELPLLIQSLVMTLAMFLMVHLCVTVRRSNQLIRARERTFSASTAEIWQQLKTGRRNSPDPAQPHRFYDFELKFFWQWTDFQSYVDCMLVIWALGAGLTFLLLEVKIFIELLGFLAAFTEAILGAPQLVRNCRNKSTIGMSISMVGMWTCGDIFKTCYFILRDSPSQFWICGSLQVMLDIAILLQVYIFRGRPIPARPMRASYRAAMRGAATHAHSHRGD
ncbi:PQ-loop repeat-containing protein 1 isoform X1 [Ctenocephalides felis]|uniref:PQ-loop repeat-containing protein 1 isoform X1 n=1 Tax=Ctenocephalides felis TaxID=7515 RepID=UPI000E6E206C|nr:PQ-loop repeat-containing protein 1 isoform X1 [Ctenocephalides felis]